MPNNDLWLRKIAAFLHDPPDKGFYYGTRDFDSIRYFALLVGSKLVPFYLNLSKTYSSNEIQSLATCLKNNWGTFVNLLTRDEVLYRRPKKSELKGICPSISSNLLSNLQRILVHEFVEREFHRIASSQLRIQNFGFKNVSEFELLIKHPLDESVTLKLEELTDDRFKSTLDNEEIKNIRNKIVKFIKNLGGESIYKGTFLKLWRFRHILSLVTPTEPTLPDNFLIDLETMQSAMATTLDDNLKVNASFLIFEFGPVQKFIANARKTRDLWFSSWLISYLAWQAMKPIADELGPDNILYPDLYKQPLVDQWLRDEIGIRDLNFDNDKLGLPTLPNTFLAIVKEGAEKSYYEKAFEFLKNAWEKITQDIWDLLVNNGFLNSTSSVKEEFDRQTQHIPFDIYWLGLKWGQNPDEAIKDYKNLLNPPKCWQFDRLWEHIKNKVRNPNIGDTYALLVEMASTGLKSMKYRGKLKVANEPGHKCSLCGERTALTDGDPDDLGSIKKFWNRMANAFPGHIKENEHLCAVCLVKRLAPNVIWEKPEKFFPNIHSNYRFDYHYPSTGSIALAPFLYKAIIAEDNGLPSVHWEDLSNTIKRFKEDPNGKGGEFLKRYILHGRSVPKVKNLISKKPNLEFFNRFEPEWLYPETPQREVVEPERHKNKLEFSPYAEKLRDAVNLAFKDFIQKVSMPKYYAAVYLDGDHLGKWIRGDNAPKIENVFHPDFVKELSNDPHFKSIKDLNRPVTPAIHRAISGALRDFALEVVPYVVEDNLGVVVYSGGDDTLFLMPLENLFNTLVALRKLYSGEQFVGEFSGRKYVSGQGFIKIYESNKLVEIIRVMGTKATLSAGVAIAHYLDPLDITLKKAQKALQDAKDKGRNRAGFYLILHSGSERKTVVPWSFVEMMERFKWKVANGFSSRFLRTLYQEVEVYQRIPDAFEAEFLRLGSRGQSENAKSLLCDLLEVRKRTGLNPKEFLEALLIADFVVREEGSK